jgi:hypothetical protein
VAFPERREFATISGKGRLTRVIDIDRRCYGVANLKVRVYRLISRVSCGGRNLILVNAPAPEILSFLSRKVAPLKRPYLHYRKRIA